MYHDPNLLNRDRLIGNARALIDSARGGQPNSDGRDRKSIGFGFCADAERNSAVGSHAHDRRTVEEIRIQLTNALAMVRLIVTALEEEIAQLRFEAARLRNDTSKVLTRIGQAKINLDYSADEFTTELTSLIGPVFDRIDCDGSRISEKTAPLIKDNLS